MADASDSKSDVGDYVWVQVPSPASYGAKSNRSGLGFAPFFMRGIRLPCNPRPHSL